MEYSCNTTFAQLGIEVGAEAMLEQAEAFGFNDHYLDDLGPQAVSVYPVGANKPQTGQSAIGQFDVRSTPLQMAMVAAGIANGGVVMKPYYVDEVQSADLDILDKTTPSELSSAVSATDRQRADQADGRDRRGRHRQPGAIDGVEVAGKTGTAQSGVEGKPPYAWYVSFAPADDPQVAVAVMIESVPAAGHRRDRRRPARRPDREGRDGGRDPMKEGRHPMNQGPTLIGGRYELGELLGRGGMAEVRKGTDTRLGPRGRGQAAAHRPGQRRDVPGPVPPRGAVVGLAQPPGDRRRSTTPARSWRPTAPASPSPTS